MNEMIERVGRAMADAVALNYDHNEAIFNLYARAAIAAMREPTQRMIWAATAATSGDGTPDEDYDDDVQTHWENMIDEALKSENRDQK